MLLTAGLSTIVCASLAWAAGTTKITTHHSTPMRWQSQDLKGTISMVDPQQDLLVVRDSNGVPFDIRVQPSTRILEGQKPVTLSQLAKDQSVDVRFVPEARGDIGRQIEVQR
jgi:hypothetical protein